MRRMAGAAILVCALGAATVSGWLSTRSARVSKASATDSLFAAPRLNAALPVEPASHVRLSRPAVPARFLLDPLAFLSSAPPESLDLLPGVGPVLATRIVDARRVRGPFRSWEDVDRIRGIGPKTIAGLQALGMRPPPAPSAVRMSARASDGNLRNARDERTSRGKPR